MSKRRWTVGGPALIGVAAALTTVAAAPAHADAIDRWRPLISEASTHFGIPASWIERVMRAESAGRTTLGGAPIRSRVGAIGLMQLMPATWAEMRARLGLGSNPDDPRDNILAGAFYLRLMYERFGYPGLFAAYNAGPARYAEYRAGRRRLPAETIAYLAAVGGAPDDATMPLASGAAPALFVLGDDRDASIKTASEPAPRSSLFAIEKDRP